MVHVPCCAGELDSPDFIQLPTQIEFESGTQGRECFRVQITDDDTFEDLETFLIVMSTLDSAVEIPQPELIVMIQDNDRMLNIAPWICTVN